MDYVVFDIETDGLLDTVSKIHVLSYQDSTMKEPVSIFDYNQMVDLLSQDRVFVGHNIIRYDMVVLKKILGVSPTNVVDTLPLSWYLNFDRAKHGLEGYGEDFGVPKPKVSDWENLTKEEYAHRCQEDVKINMRLYKDLIYKLNKLYLDTTEAQRFIQYLNFKMDCMREQEELGWRLDVTKAQEHYDTLIEMQDEKLDQLSAAMPKRPILKVRNRPKIMYKKDGSLSSKGEDWLGLLKSMRMPNTTETVNIVDGYEDANPNSTDQVKSWLYSLGWEPATYKYVRNKTTGEERSIEQVRRDGELCPSVLLLVDENPSVELLDGLTVIQHRLGIFKSFLECHKDGWLKAEVAGFTNTLRFRHARPLVNLPGVERPWGKEIRGCLIAGNGNKLCGADMTSLEDTTKRHYMKPLDPDYVEEMQKKGFDPHLDLARHAGRVTQEDIDAYNRGERPEIKRLRKAFKVVNYSATYGVGAAKLARETGMSQAEAATLLEAFWSRNWAVQKVAADCRVRTVNGSDWLQNPVSGFWHQLRSDKDRFSTLNQSTGVYCFDQWVAQARLKFGVKTIGQFHDEIISIVSPEEVPGIGDKLEAAIQAVNDKVKLNVPLGIDYAIGDNYAEIH